MNRILNGNFQLEEFSRKRWVAKVAATTPMEDLLNPDYWAHVAPQLEAGAIIDAYSIDMRWAMTLFVRAASKNEAVVGIINKVVFGEQARDMFDYEPVFHETTKWGVVRGKEKLLVAEGLPTKEAALDWIAKRKNAQPSAQSQGTLHAPKRDVAKAAA